VDSIIPWQAQRSVGALDKSDKWREVINAAARQSRRSRLPELASMTNLAGVLAASSHFDSVIAFHESGEVSLSAVPGISVARSILAIIGPEGGLSTEEIDQLTASGIPLVKLGDPVLRADLAGAIALGALKVLTNQW
jgi:16S rRNA (uracil1498-N3)-methyltransferase